VAGLGPEAVRIQATTSERLCLGQLHESMGPGPDGDPVAHYLQVLSDKTASLIATSARLGAMYGNCAPQLVETVAAFGERIGVAFQLADDVIDLTADGSLTGKTPGTDLREKVPTMPVLLLRDRAAAPDADPADVALVALLDSDLTEDAALARAVAGLRAHDVVRETRERALALVQEAVDLLAPLPEGPVKASFVSFAEALVDRAS
jgi:heptaprenyl diphosphate synthase